MSSTISEQTKIVLPLMSWWQLAVLIVALAGLYFGMKGDISNAVEQSTKNAAEMTEVRKRMDELWREQLEMKYNVNTFKNQYEADQKRLGTR